MKSWNPSFRRILFCRMGRGIWLFVELLFEGGYYGEMERGLARMQRLSARPMGISLSVRQGLARIWASKSLPTLLTPVGQVVAEIRRRIRSIPGGFAAQQAGVFYSKASQEITPASQLLFDPYNRPPVPSSKLEATIKTRNTNASTQLATTTFFTFRNPQPSPAFPLPSPRSQTSHFFPYGHPGRSA